MKTKRPNVLKHKNLVPVLPVLYDEDDFFSMQLRQILDDLGREEVSRIANTPNETIKIIQEADLQIKK